MTEKGDINKHLLINKLDSADFISYSMKIKNFLNYISAVIYSSRNDVYNKFNNVNSDEYFTHKEKEAFLKDLLAAGYECANSDILEFVKLKKNKSKIANLINEILPILKMKINLNDSSMFVIDFYLIERRKYKRSVASAASGDSSDSDISETNAIKLPFHFSMRLSPHNININSWPNECYKFGDYDNSINKLNKENNYGVPHVTFECYKEKAEDLKNGGGFTPQTDSENIKPNTMYNKMASTKTFQDPKKTSTNTRGLQERPTNFQELQERPTNFQGMSPNFQVFQERPTNFQGMSPNFQVFQERPTNFQGMSPNFQGFQERPTNFQGMSPNFQGFQERPTNFQGMSPNFQGFQERPTNFQGMSPNFQGFQEQGMPTNFQEFQEQRMPTNFQEFQEQRMPTNFQGFQGQGMPTNFQGFQGQRITPSNFQGFQEFQGQGMPHPNFQGFQWQGMHPPNFQGFQGIQGFPEFQGQGMPPPNFQEFQGFQGQGMPPTNFQGFEEFQETPQEFQEMPEQTIQYDTNIRNESIVRDSENKDLSKSSKIKKSNVNVCKEYNITSVSTRNNHAYLNVSKSASPIDYFKYFLELLSDKNYLSNISSLINIERTEDTDDISCIQKNKGDKRLMEIYINMALKAVVKLLTAFKNYYDDTILEILKDPNNPRDKLRKYINNIESSMQRTDKEVRQFSNSARKYELQILKNLLCSINADKDYKKYLGLSVKSYNEYLEKYIAYEENKLHILTMKSTKDIKDHLSRSISDFGELIIKYNMYVIYSVRSYSAYTHMNSAGIEKYPNIDPRVVNIYPFSNMTNVTKVNFFDKVLINYILVFPNSITISDELIKELYLQIDKDNLESYTRELLKTYTGKDAVFNDYYINNIIEYVFDLYFNHLSSIVVKKHERQIDDSMYISELKSLKEKYYNFLNIISTDEIFQDIYEDYKSQFIKKYRKYYKIDREISEFLLNTVKEKKLSDLKVKPRTPTKMNVRSPSKVNVRSPSKLNMRGGMPPKKVQEKKPINYRQQIIDNLRILADYEKLNKEPFKMRAYNKVIESIELIDNPIGNMEDVKNINGVGDKIALKIKELIETGKMTAVENALKDPKFSLQKQLSKLYGVGPVKINELMSKITSFDELYTNPELLNDKQKIGLKYYKDMELRIPLSEGKKHYKIIDKTFKQTNDKIEFELVGSYRRKNKDMGDIDILIKNSDDLSLKKLISNLVESGYIIETLASGKSKFMGLCKLSPDLPARRIDILIAEPSYYYFALLYFTGSYSFNIYMRKIALEKGYSLSEYGIKGKDNKLIDTSDAIKSEEDIFKFLNIPYVAPDKRNVAE